MAKAHMQCCIQWLIRTCLVSCMYILIVRDTSSDFVWKSLGGGEGRIMGLTEGSAN